MWICAAGPGLSSSIPKRGEVIAKQRLFKVVDGNTERIRHFRREELEMVYSFEPRHKQGRIVISAAVWDVRAVAEPQLKRRPAEGVTVLQHVRIISILDARSCPRNLKLGHCCSNNGSRTGACHRYLRDGEYGSRHHHRQKNTRSARLEAEMQEPGE